MPKSKSQPHFLTEYMDQHEKLAIATPELCRLVSAEEGNFRGLTCFLGDNNSVVLGVKRFNSDGVAMIMWTSGHDFIAALMNLNSALAVGKWKVDNSLRKEPK